MTIQNEENKTLADVLAILVGADLPAGRHRAMTSAINRICELGGWAPAGLAAEPVVLREQLKKIRPAAAGIQPKTFANVRSLFSAALDLVGVTDSMGRGEARRHPIWGPFAAAIASDKRLSNGLAAFMNWCATNEIAPEAVTDEAVQRFLHWLDTRTLHPRPRDLVCRVPRLWNEAGARISSWPQNSLTRHSFRPPQRRLGWEQLSDSFRADAEAYLRMRAEPDVFDEALERPRRPLAPATLRLQSENLRLAASVLVETGVAVAEITSLADLVQPERFKGILRYYHRQAHGEPSAFAIVLAKTLIQVAAYHVGAPTDQVATLKRLAGNLPEVPFDLTRKNKALLRQLESDRLKAALLFLPEQLVAKAARALKRNSALPFVKAQVAVAIDIQLAVSLRPQNLSALCWREHFHRPNPSERLLLHIPADQTKTKRRDLTAEIPDDVAERLNWYRQRILPRLKADPNGYLFVTETGAHKSQETLSQQIVEVIAKYVGIHMTPHQFRHFCAVAYLEVHPEDTETAREVLGHASAKTTRIYVGSSGRRASRAYSKMLFEQRERLRLKTKRRPAHRR